MIRTNEEKILIYSKGDYDIKLVAPNYKKIKLESVNNKVLIICYWDYMINEITSVITKYFKNDKIKRIINLTNNLDENWNDILSLSLDNSISNNNFNLPKIEIIKNQKKKDISVILNKYNFEIIYKYYKDNIKKIKKILLII